MNPFLKYRSYGNNDDYRIINDEILTGKEARRKRRARERKRK